jgi:hypothetical protein
VSLPSPYLLSASRESIILLLSASIPILRCQKQSHVQLVGQIYGYKRRSQSDTFCFQSGVWGEKERSLANETRFSSPIIGLEALLVHIDRVYTTPYPGGRNDTASPFVCADSED